MIAAVLKLIPIWVWPMIGLLLWGGYGHLKYQGLRAHQAEAAVEAQRLANKARSRQEAERDKVDAEYVKKLRETSKFAESLRDANGRLRDKLTTTYSPDPTDAVTVCGVDGERGRILERLLSESSALASEGAARVRSLGAKNAALQEHIRKVCVGAPNADQ